MTTIPDLPNKSVYKYKPNDPYYFEVDNKPLDQLEANDNHLQNTLQTVNDETELKLDDQQVTDKINNQYTAVTIPWADGKFFDEDELFVVGSKMSGLHPRGTSTEVYTRGEIEWDPAQFTNGNLFTQFLRSFIVDPANLPVDSGGNPWGWGTGERLFSFFYDKATIDAMLFQSARLDKDEVDAIDATGSSSRVLVDSSQTAQLPTSTNPFVVQEQITNIKDSTESGTSISPTNKIIDADLLRAISIQTQKQCDQDLLYGGWTNVYWGSTGYITREFTLTTIPQEDKAKTIFATIGLFAIMARGNQDHCILTCEKPPVTPTLPQIDFERFEVWRGEKQNDWVSTSTVVTVPVEYDPTLDEVSVRFRNGAKELMFEGTGRVMFLGSYITSENIII